MRPWQLFLSLRVGYLFILVCERIFLADVYLLDCPLFNAGKGAVFNARGKVCREIYTCYVYRH